VFEGPAIAATKASDGCWRGSRGATVFPGTPASWVSRIPLASQRPAGGRPVTATRQTVVCGPPLFSSPRRSPAFMGRLCLAPSKLSFADRTKRTAFSLWFSGPAITVSIITVRLRLPLLRSLQLVSAHVPKSVNISYRHHNCARRQTPNPASFLLGPSIANGCRSALGTRQPLHKNSRAGCSHQTLGRGNRRPHGSAAGLVPVVRNSLPGAMCLTLHFVLRHCVGSRRRCKTCHVGDRCRACPSISTGSYRDSRITCQTRRVREQVKKRAAPLRRGDRHRGASIKMRCNDYWYSALRTASGQSAHRAHTQ